MNYNRGNPIQFIVQSSDFYSQNYKIKNKKLQKFVEIKAQKDVKISVFHNLLFFELRSDWDLNNQTYKRGSLLYITIDDYLINNNTETMKILFEPTKTVSLYDINCGLDIVMLTVLDNVKTKLLPFKLINKKNELQPMKPIDKLIQGDENSKYNTLSCSAMDYNNTNDFFITATGFTLPTSLYILNLDNENTKVKLIKSLPSFFNAEDVIVEQHFAKSNDGTMIPYFQIGMKRVDPVPCLLYAYGGFEISLLPSYMAISGKSWLERGGTFVLANIRGGGEYSGWHKSALRENRYLAYEDFESIAEDLIKRNVTTSAQLAIQGGSNGGLLVGNSFVRRPELFQSVICEVPLLDMKRYTKLLAGAS